MISFFEASLEQLIVHYVGNKAIEERLSVSDKSLDLSDETLEQLLKYYCLSHFQKATQVYNLSHPSGNVQVNSVWNSVSRIFNNKETFIKQSEELACLLYEIANHPKIKSGEFYVALFSNVQIEGDLHEAIGLFKSETKDTYLKLYMDKDGYAFNYEQEGVNINKLDKGCLIFNTEKDKGYKVVVVDQAKGANSSAVYWKDEFLQLKVRNDNHTQTANFLDVFKSYVAEEIDTDFEVDATEKAQLLNDAVKYFKEHEQFDADEFANTVLRQAELTESFTSYKDKYSLEFEANIPDTFDISHQTVKTRLNAFKTVIKLDKNFHLYVHGNKELIEQGYDTEKGMNYYKVFYKEQS